MKTCPKCGKKYDDSYSFCSACGLALVEPAASGLMGSMGNTKYSGGTSKVPNASSKETTTSAGGYSSRLMGSMGGKSSYGSGTGGIKEAEVKKSGSSSTGRKADNKTNHKGWMKYVAIAAAVLALVIIVLSVSNNGRSSNSQSFSSNQTYTQNKNGHYYTIEQARTRISSEGYHLGDDISNVSNDGYFTYRVGLQNEDFKFLNISGYVDFTAQYSEESQTWYTSIEPNINYNWKVSGNWYADTEDYDVYLNIISFDNSTLILHATIEAQYDSTEGGKGSYGAKDVTVTMRFTNDDFRIEDKIYDAFIYCEVTAGYPVFTLRIDKDSMTMWQLYDSYHAELVSN